MSIAIYTEQVKRWNDDKLKPDAQLLEPTEYAVLHTEQDPRSSAAEIRVSNVRRAKSIGKDTKVLRIKPVMLDIDGELVISMEDLDYVLANLIEDELTS